MIKTIANVLSLCGLEYFNYIFFSIDIGFFVCGSHRWFLYFIGIIADCHAMKLVLNHIGNNGYYACWLCKIRGVHILTKRQYHFEEVPNMRTVDSYIYESKNAMQTNENVHGHLGLSILHQILDVPLPHSIIIDYMHVTLLRHARSVVQQLYTSMKPKQRIELDNKLSAQQFPHMFHRKMKPIANKHVKYVLLKIFLLYKAPFR